jgi:type I restriction enzyme S subunit
VINELWPLQPLGELFEIGAGKTMSAAAREGEGRTPFLRTSNVLWDEIDLGELDEMVIAEEELKKKSLRRGDLLVCEGGEIGRAAVWDGQRNVMSFQNHLHRLRPLVDSLEPRFYVYFLQSAFTQLGIYEGVGNKTTIPNLSRNRLAALNVPKPPIDEQRDIVQVLATIREGMKMQEKAIRLAIDLNRTAMHSLFTKGLRGDAGKETEFGLVPQSWELRTVGHYTRQMQYGLSVRGEASGKYPILRMNCQKDGKVVMRDLQYVNIDDATAREYQVRFNDILFNRTNSYELVGRTAIVEDPTDAVFASYLVRISLDQERLEPRFLNHLLNWEKTQAELKKLASRGVSQANISAGKLRDFVIPVPDIAEQREIVEVLDAVGRKIDLHHRKRAAVEELFKALLHKLMTGEIRVADLNLTPLVPKQMAEVAA